MAASYFGFGLTDDEAVLLEERVNSAVHSIELFHALGKYTGIIAVPARGDAFREPFGFTDAVPFVVFTEGAVQFIHNDHKEERGQGAPLFNSLVHFHRGCDVPFAVCSHFQSGPTEGGHDKRDKVGPQADVFECLFDAGPTDRVIGLGYVIVDGIASLTMFFPVTVAGYGRINGFVDISPGYEGELGFV